MIKKILLITLGFSIAAGGFWGSQAQDPPPQNVRTDPPVVAAQSTQTDLSGTYAGTFNCEALGLTGDTTLTITGNEFTLADGRKGRLVTSTTRGYTAVALQLTPAATPGATTTPQVVSLRAKKSRDRLTLTSVDGTKMKCSFVPSKVARGKRTPAATGTEVSNPAAVPTESPMPSQTPSPIPSPSPTESPTPVPSPGEPAPSPTASPTPSPSPSPRPGN